MTSPPEPSPAMADVVRARLDRRALLAGAAAGAALLGLPRFLAADEGLRRRPPFRFAPRPLKILDDHHVAAGHRAEVLIRWGDPVLAGAPPFDPAALTAAGQARQFGLGNDFTSFHPLPRGSRNSTHGLLCVNHEYTNARFLWSDETRYGSRKPERIAVEMAAHGQSVIEVRKTKAGWQVVPDSPYARRITATTPMDLAGPVRGHARVKTSADPTGTRVLGTLWNCAGGTTPWGTVLSAEENFENYFLCPPGTGGAEARNHALYGLGAMPGGLPALAWHHADPRFDVRREPHEPNRFGWVVEYDPYDPTSRPVKRTALGRFKHESATAVLNHDGRVVIYSGDDEEFQFVYRFVSKGRFDPAKPQAHQGLLDHGTLSAARFDPDGSLHWLPLIHGQGPLVAKNGFRDAGDVLLETRRAARLLGATPMDRPEDIEVDARTGRVYVVMTKNRFRTATQVDAANRRACNEHGHVLELTPPDASGTPPVAGAAPGDHAAGTARWDLFLLGGAPTQGRPNNPDNLVFDPSGRLWIATDQGREQARNGCPDGLWACETDGPRRGTATLFYACPRGAELCGPTFTPDGRTLFVSVQHPGQGRHPDGRATRRDDPATRWPDFVEGQPPRCSVVAITRPDGGRVGG
ncbi:MAG: PhoX family phosphatase [Planctomycetota bacterium]|nr:PhoX family phosphatase [Planctomycetota bacterium]